MDQFAIEKALAELAAADPDVAAAIDLVGLPPPRNRPQGFETMLAIIISQQISTAAANTILDRVSILMPQITPAALLGIDDQQLRTAGMSYRKIEYARGLARAIRDGSFPIDSLPSMHDREAIATITSLRGFGRWSAEIYLMFCLGRKDIFPGDDLALLLALGRLKRLQARPTAAQARQMVARWSPWRSAGALLLWHYYRRAP